MTVTRTVDASPGQRLLGIMEHYRGEDSPLNLPVLYRLRGDLDRDALAAALDTLVARHEALRTSYEMSGRRLVQRVHDPWPLRLERRTVAGGPAQFESEILLSVRARFDLAVPPVRATLWDIAPDDAVLLLNIHHLSTDGWSGGVIADDLGHLYRPGPAPAALAPVASWQYPDFSEWQRRRWEEGLLAEHQQFWRERLAGIHAPVLPGSPPGRTGGGQRPGTQTFDVAEQAVDGLAGLCRARRVSLFTAALAAFAAVVHAQAGDLDFGLASMFANRSREELAGTVGFVANLLVLRFTLPERPTFDQVLAAAQDMVFDALAHQEVPYHLVPQRSGERAAGLENILFQMMAGPDYQLALAGLDVTQLPPPRGAGSRFDLEFALIPAKSGLRGVVWFDRRRFPVSWVRKLVSDYRAMVAGVAAHPDRPVTCHLSVP